MKSSLIMNLTAILVLCAIHVANGRAVELLMNPNSNEISNYGVEDSRENSMSKNNFLVEKKRLSNAEWSSYNFREPNGPGTYAFGFDNVYDQFGNEQFRSEEKLANGTVVGEYGYTDKKSNQLIRVNYVADHRGYRAKTNVIQFLRG